MDIKNFNEALYASSNGVIVERRKSIVMPLVILLIGILFLVVNSFVKAGDDTNNLKSFLVLAGGLVTIVGVAYFAVNIFGGGAPYHAQDKCFLERKQYAFERTQIDAVVKAVEACDKVALDAISEGDIAALSVICYYSPKSNYCAMQAFIYEDFVYNSVTKLALKS